MAKPIDIRLSVGCRGRGFASEPLKLGIAVLAASIGVVLAVRGLIPSRSEHTDTPKPRIVTADGSTPAPVSRGPAPAAESTEWFEAGGAPAGSFEKVTSAEAARTMLTAVGTTIDALARSNHGAQGNLGADIASFLMPVLTGEGDISQAVASLGGDGSASARGIDGLLGTLLGLSSIDANAITIRETNESPEPMPGMSVSRNRNESTDPSGETTTTDTIDILMTMQNSFPAAIGENARGPMLELAIPLRTKAAKGPEGNATLLMLTRWNASAGAWQPARIRLRTTDTSAMDRVMQALRASAPAEGGG